MLEITDKNIEALRGYAESAEERSRGFDTSFMYKIFNATLPQIKSRAEAEPELVKQLKKSVYGANVLHFALLHPNIEVFRYVVDLFKDNSVDIKKYNCVKSFRKLSIGTQTVMLLEGTTLMNVALSIASIEKMEYLKSLGLGQIYLPKITNAEINSYPNATHFNAEPTLITYCNFLACNPQKVFETESSRAAFYFNFATSFDSFDNLLAAESRTKITLSPNGILKRFANLLAIEEPFQSEVFRTKYYPALIEKSFNKYSYYSLFDNVDVAMLKSLDFFSIYAKPGEYAPLRDVIKNNAPLLEKLSACEEKATLSNTITAKSKSTTSKL